MIKMRPNFSGYASKHDLLCADGRTIKAGAFQHQDKMKVPLVWQHQHDAPGNVLGHAILEYRPNGVYAHGFFNNSDEGKKAKELVEHGDINMLSIFANNLRQQGKNVLHGNIREVSLVLSGANPGAYIESVNIQHGDTLITPDDEAIIYHGIEGLDLDAKDEGLDLEHQDNSGENMADSTTQEKTIGEVYNSLTDEQKEVVNYLVGEAINASEDDGEDDEVEHGAIDLDTFEANVADRIIKHMKEQESVTHNIFEQGGATGSTAGAKNTLTHDQVQTIVRDGIKMGSFKESFLAHAEDYGITNIDLLFPDAKTLADKPELLARQADWVPKVLNATKHSPFAKVKTIVADLTPAAARAKGYVKGNMKKEEVISLLKRTTGPATLYKKQKLDRDDILDITDFDVVAWLKWEIRFMLNEELARAILVGDGRSNADEDKIKDPAGAQSGDGIRSILHDHDMYAHKVVMPANVSDEGIIDEITRARTAYRGSGNPTLYTTDKVLTDMLLIKDRNKRRVYETEAALAAALRVKEIVTVEVLEEHPTVLGIVVNLMDYTIGSNKGGELTFFEDFDIDFNQNKYLLETRLSGGLTKPKSALVITREVGEAVETVTPPSFNGATNTITIPVKTGVVYTINGEPVTGSVVITEDTTVEAEGDEGYYIPAGVNTSWPFIYTDQG